MKFHKFRNMNDQLPSAVPPLTAVDQLVYDAPPSLDEWHRTCNASPLSAVSTDANMPPPLKFICQDGDDDCALCVESLRFGGQLCSTIKTCKHQFHSKCIKECLKMDRKCPICRDVVGGTPQGPSPSGTMSISLSRQHCPGFGRSKTIQIDYALPNGVQLPYHENPGQGYKGTNRRAYLPDNEEGRELLARLKFAWLHGLVFAIGTSLTTGQANAVIWSSIHHKTSLAGGPHGFPDLHFVENCNESLTALGVPPAAKTKPKLLKKVRSASFPYQAPPTLHANLDFNAVLEEVVSCNNNTELEVLPAPALSSATTNISRPTSPSGTMTIEITDKQFPGYAPCIKIVEIRYKCEAGIQLAYHENPGTLYSNTERVAFLPSTPEGMGLLTRLKHAFTNGLVFAIGTSLTTGRANSITWSKIPHKTSVTGGNFGFPDPNYFTNCHEALSALGVPEADAFCL